MLWRVVAGLALAVLITVSAVMGSGLLAGEDEWSEATGSHRFNIVRWELENLFDKWRHKVEGLLRPDDATDAARAQMVRDYLSLYQHIASLQSTIERSKAEGSASASDISVLEEQLTALTVERDALEAQVEEIVEGQISAVLAEQGLARSLRLGDEVDVIFPPVDFAFDERPRVLIVSPRERIEILHSSVLRPDISLDDVLGVESRVEDMGFSALVESTGGIATYPSIVPLPASVDALMAKVAHEWLHHYFFFYPLGRNYWASYEMTSVNETAADIAGKEIAGMVYERYYEGGETEPVPPGQPDGQPFDFNREMREIRITVDRYLEEGLVDTAEDYMEERRQFLAENGYYIRKLNQAYFAFHGTYADSPTSVSPIGEQLQKVRHDSSSVGDFIAAVSAISSYDDLLAMLDQADGT